MVSYRAKGINKFTFVNLRLRDGNRLEWIFLLAALVSTGSPPATAKLLCSTRSGVTCPYSTRRRRRRDFPSDRNGSRWKLQASRPEETACWLHSRAYCFIFSQNVSGLTNRTTCPGCGETVTLPHVFAEAYPWSRISFVLKFFSSSHE